MTYKGTDTVLLFCENHVLDMLYDYKEFKDLEQDNCLVSFICNPYLIYISKMNDLEIHRLFLLLSKTLTLRLNFQSKIECKHSSGHKHWMHKIQEAIDQCDLRLWKTPRRRRCRRLKDFSVCASWGEE